LAKIAVKFAPDPALNRSRPIAPPSRLLARGKGWSVADVVCTAGPGDRPFEEQHSGVSIGMVLEGTFQYRFSGIQVNILSADMNMRLATIALRSTLIPNILKRWPKNPGHRPGVAISLVCAFPR
jgi:hypothetical protein